MGCHHALRHARNEERLDRLAWNRRTDARELWAALRRGQHVVVDHVLWRRKDSDDWQGLAEAAGGEVRLLFFLSRRTSCYARLNRRNT